MAYINKPCCVIDKNNATLEHILFLDAPSEGIKISWLSQLIVAD
jgi:hypothetical protein